MHPITIRRPFRPRRRSCAVGWVTDHFGIRADQPPYVVVDNAAIDTAPGEIVLFQGRSGSGKSSLLSEMARRFDTVDIDAIQPPDDPMIDLLSGPMEDRLRLLNDCGLGEARLFLRSDDELSEGQRKRLRLALGFDRAIRSASPIRPVYLKADEFAGNLDRTAARVVSHTVRKLVTRTGIGLFAATAHDDLAEDLRPDRIVRCDGLGGVTVAHDRDARQGRPISFGNEVTIAEGSIRDWDRFAPWHYREGEITFVRKVVVMHHGERPIGIVVFTSAPATLRARSEFFALSGRRSQLSISALNQQLWMLARVVIDPCYRGAGLGIRLVKEACRMCPVPWVETLAVMGAFSPIFERAGFAKVRAVDLDGTLGKTDGHFGRDASLRAGPRNRYVRPWYYVLDNRPIRAK